MFSNGLQPFSCPICSLPTICQGRSFGEWTYYYPCGHFFPISIPAPMLAHQQPLPGILTFPCPSCNAPNATLDARLVCANCIRQQATLRSPVAVSQQGSAFQHPVPLASAASHVPSIPIPIPAAIAMASVHEEVKVCEFCERQNSVRNCRLSDETTHMLCGACARSYLRGKPAGQSIAASWLSSWIQDRKTLAETAPLRGQKNGICTVCGYESDKCGNRNFFGVICYACDACARAYRRIKNKAATSLETWRAERIKHAHGYHKSWI